MSEFLTRYPRRISVVKGLHDFIRHEEIQFDHLSLMVRIKKDEIIKTLISEGFRRVKLENRKPFQIGNGFAKKLGKPWELHVRLLEVHQQGLIAIQAEVEISRRYVEHIRSVRAPVIYEIESILRKHSIEYRIWNAKVRDYIANVIDNVAPAICRVRFDRRTFCEAINKEPSDERKMRSTCRRELPSAGVYN